MTGCIFLQCEPETAAMLGAERYNGVLVPPLGSIIIIATDGSRWLWPIDNDAWRQR